MSVEASVEFTVGETTGSIVGPEHFGTNMLFHHDRVDDDSTFPVLIDQTGIEYIRYPGGTVTEEYFDISDPTAEVQSSAFGGNDRAVEPLDDFLNYADDAGLSVVVVIPTYRFFDPQTGEIDPDAEEIVKTFVRELMSGTYGEADIYGIEIGNEWYQDQFEWSAEEFGEIQSQIALWIDEVLQEFPDEPDVNVFIQAGRGDDDGNGIDDNAEIAAQFNDEELAAIDGLVCHIYTATSSGNPLVLGGTVDNRLTDLQEYWDVSGETGLDIIVTEWNVGDDGPDNTSVSGLMRSTALIRMFSDMMENGVDAATIWTAQAPSPAALGTPEGDEDLTATGLLFLLMYDALIGTQVVTPDGSNSIQNDAGETIGRHFVFQSDGQTIIYLTSAVDETINISTDFSAFLSEDSHIHASVLGVAEGTDPTDFTADATIETISSSNFDDTGVYDFQLNAYETVQIVITTDQGVSIKGDPQSVIADVLEGTQYDDEIQGYGGSDTIIGGSGHDLIYAGSEGDLIFGEGDKDTIYGGGGDDEVWGGHWHDVIYGEDGNDFLAGEMGDDVLLPGSGNDTIDGGEGSDTLDYSQSNQGVRIYAREDATEYTEYQTLDHFYSIERFVGSDFDDTISGSPTTSYIDGGKGNDAITTYDGDNTTVDAGQGDDYVLVLYGSATVHLGEGDDTLCANWSTVSVYGGNGQDAIYGHSGADSISGGAGNDLLFGGDGSDVFIFEQVDSSDFIGDFSAGEDVLDFSALNTSYSQLVFVSGQDGVEVFMSQDLIATLSGVSVTELSEADFVF